MADAFIQFGQQKPQSKFNNAHAAVIHALPKLLAARKLYDGQVKALMGAQNHFADLTKHNIGLVVLPTGSGKSGVAALAPYVLNATRVLVLTPSPIISTQLFRDMSSSVPGETFYEKRGLCTTDQLSLLQEMGLLVKKTLGDDAAQVAQRFSKFNLVIVNAHKFGPNSSFHAVINQLDPGLFDLVIVDEAHHYPAATWRVIVERFDKSSRLFLTATPSYKGGPIIGNTLADQNAKHLVFQLSREDAVAAGNLRPLNFEEVGAQNDSDATRINLVVQRMNMELVAHDAQDNSIVHQAMILCRTTEEVEAVAGAINALWPAAAGQPNVAQPYHGSKNKTGFDQFRLGQGPRWLVVCGKATEGFDRQEVSVVGILRNVAPSSMVLFSQFVGRCVRRRNGTPAQQAADVVTALVVSHVTHKQQDNFTNMDKMAEVDPEDDEEDD